MILNQAADLLSKGDPKGSKLDTNYVLVKKLCFHPAVKEREVCGRTICAELQLICLARGT